MRNVQFEIPDDPWEPDFFEELEIRTSAVGLLPLRMLVLPERDLEVRFWYERLGPINGVVIRRVGEEWSAGWIYQKQESVPKSAQLLKLDPPISGWDVLWKDLVDAGILRLPDNSKVQCPAEALDGVSYIVETNVSRKYRTYAYSNPMLMKCSEAKQIVAIEEIIRSRFKLDRFKK